MQLDAVSAVLRPRQHWEAIDLGFAMVQRWLWPLYRVWLLVTLPLFVLLNLACWQAPWLAAVLLWWLKPLLDRIPLFILSRALFGASPSLRETFNALPGLLLRRSIPALTWLRFDPARSFHLPVIQLEGLRGRQLRERQRVLNQGAPGRVWLTMVCIHLDAALQIALLAMFAMLFPEFISWDIESWFAQLSRAEQIGLNLLAWTAITVIEPFYVAAGFALYLNRRTTLEAWDIEIGFRRLAERLAQFAKPVVNNGATLFIVALLTLSATAPETTFAQNNNEPETVVSEACKHRFARQDKLRDADSAIQQELAEVFNEPAFPQCQLESRWIMKDRNDSWDLGGSSTSFDNPLSKGLAALIEFILWIAFAVATGSLIWWLVLQMKQRGLPARRSTTAAATPALFLHGQEISVEHYADDTAEQVWNLWQQQHYRQALGLLYRASLAGLLQQYRIDFGDSATETECLEKASEQLGQSELIQFLRNLTSVWQSVAYAHRIPADVEVSRLCQQWPGYFVSTEKTDIPAQNGADLNE